jgi:hypothetical protein
MQAALQRSSLFKQVANLAAGQQMDFAITPTASCKHTIESKGASDALLVLFEHQRCAAVVSSGTLRQDSTDVFMM